MILFILIYLAFYGSMHAYAFFKARAAFRFGINAGLLTAAFMTFMMFAPIITRALEHAGHETAALIIACSGYVWMGSLSIFVLIAILIGVYRLIVFAAGNFFRINTEALIPSAFMAFVIPAFLAVILSGYGIYEGLHIRTEHVRINTAKIPPSAGRIRIVQISDVHLGLMAGRYRLENIIRSIIKADPDILVSTGDLIDGQLDNIEDNIKLFNRTKPRFGKFAVTGNHEVYAGLGLSIRLTESAGFRMLRNSAASAGNSVIIAGFDDRGHSSSKTSDMQMERELLSKLPEDKFIVILKHKPEPAERISGLFDLQLSGHLHGGQIFPFIPLVRIAYPFVSGLHKLPEDSRLYISRGTGLWGPPMRVFAPPEITVIDLIPVR
jgi:predicted MPP superfamily phosphohydrolase